MNLLTNLSFKMLIMIILGVVSFYNQAFANGNLPVVYSPSGGPVKVLEISDVNDPELLKEKLLKAIEAAGRESRLSPEELKVISDALKKAIELDLFLSRFHTQLLAEALKRTDTELSLVEAQADGGVSLVEEMFKVFSEIIRQGVRPGFLDEELYFKLLVLRGDNNFLMAYKNLLQMSFDELTFLVRSKLTFTKSSDTFSRQAFKKSR